MGRSLNALDSGFRPKAEQIITLCTQSGLPVRVVDTDRTPTEQEQKLAAKQSWTHNSLHLPQPDEGKSKAIDLVPECILEENKANWDPTSAAWQRLGQIGKSVPGVKWGGDWKHINESSPGAGDGTGDPSHFEEAPPSGPVPEMGVEEATT